MGGHDSARGTEGMINGGAHKNSREKESTGHMRSVLGHLRDTNVKNTKEQTQKENNGKWK